MKVAFSKMFANNFRHFPKKDQDKINAFIYHVSLYGLNHLTGRNKSSDNVHTDDPDFLKKIAKVRKHNLWHYHIGIPNYETAGNGDKVSEYVLHYIRGEDYIKIVDLDSHPPFTLPSDEYIDTD